MSRAPSSSLTTSSSLSKIILLSTSSLYLRLLHMNLILIQYFRYAEIVNVRLGDGSLRKGQVLEIAGKRAVVQVRLPRLNIRLLTLRIDFRRNIRHWQPAHSRWIHRWCPPYAHQHWDAWKVIQRFRYSHWSRSPSARWEILRHIGKIAKSWFLQICAFWDSGPYFRNISY